MKKMNRERLFASTLLAGVASFGVPLAVGTAALSVSTDAMAQQTSVIFSGRVQSTDGSGIPNATISVTNEFGVSRTATSTGSGRFSIEEIPPGEYEVRIEADGHQLYFDEAVPIRIAASTFNFTLAAVGDDEIVVTAARQPTLEFNRTATGLVVNVEELASRIPLGRDVADVMLLAPGAVPGDESFAGPGSNYGRVTSISGASIGENAFYVNGLNVTNARTLIGGSRIPFEFYDSVEVRTGGYQAEYGRATGGIVNAVTKSGSNEYHWGIVGSVSSGDMNDSTSPNTFAALNQFDERANHSFAVYASGPIVPDRLFFYGIYESQSTSSSDATNTPGFPNDPLRQELVNDSPFYGANVTWNILDGHRLDVTYFSDENETEVEEDKINAITGQVVEERGVFQFGGGGISQMVRYTGDFTDWLTLSASWGRNEQSDFIRAAPNPTLATFDTTLGFTRNVGGLWNVGGLQEADDSRDLYRVDADIRFDLLGEHHIRMGMDREDLETNQSNFNNGPCTDIVAVAGIVSGTDSISNGQCLNVTLQRFSLSTTGAGGPYPGGRWRYNYYSNVGGFSSETEAWYVQDSWSPLEGLTLQLGVRSDTYRNSNLDGDVFIEMADQIAPRVGFSWDPGNDGLSKLYGSFGTYYLPVATNTNVRLGGAEFFHRYRYSAAGLNPDGTPFGLVYRDTQIFSNGIVPTLEQARADALDPFQEDEWVLGYERAFGEWTLGVNYTHRELVQVIEDSAIDSAVQAYCLAESAGATNCSSTFSGTHQYVLVNPGSDVTVQLNTELTALGDAPGTLRTLSLSAEDLGYPEAERILDQVQFTFERPFDGRWGVQGSYTWMDSRGNYEGAVKSDVGQDDAGLTQDFDLPGLIVGANGQLPNHREHTLRVFGSYSPFENFLVGANVLIQSPRKFGCLGVSAEPFAQLYGASAFSCIVDGVEGVVTPRGTIQEADWRQNLDLSFVWNQEVQGGGGDVSLRFDIFNVFDNDAVTDLNEVGDIATGNFALAGSPGPFATVNPTSGLPTRFQAPRRYQVGVALRF